MARYLVRRLIEVIMTLWIIVTFLFFLFRLMPGDPVSLILDPSMSAESKAMIRAQYGLDKPMIVQYGLYIKNLLKGDFGESFNYGIPVVVVIIDRLPNTLLLFASATIFSYILGITFGRIIAWRRGSKTEYTAVIVSLTLYNMPIFWLGLIMIFVFSYKFGWTPLGRMTSPEIWIQEEIPLMTKVLDVLYHLALPLITLTIWMLATSMLLMRNSMLEVMNEDYVTTAFAKGLPEKVVRNKHVGRNAMLPVTTAFGLSLAYAVSGGVLTETVFSWPGIGWEIVNATIKYDYPLVQACFFVLALVVLIMMLVIDILYTFLDPRIRY